VEEINRQASEHEHKLEKLEVLSSAEVRGAMIQHLTFMPDTDDVNTATHNVIPGPLNPCTLQKLEQQEAGNYSIFPEGNPIGSTSSFTCHVRRSDRLELVIIGRTERELIDRWITYKTELSDDNSNKAMCEEVMLALGHNREEDDYRKRTKFMKDADAILSAPDGDANILKEKLSTLPCLNEVLGKVLVFTMPCYSFEFDLRLLCKILHNIHDVGLPYAGCENWTNPNGYDPPHPLLSFASGVSAGWAQKVKPAMKQLLVFGPFLAVPRFNGELVDCIGWLDSNALNSKMSTETNSKAQDMLVVVKKSLSDIKNSGDSLIGSLAGQRLVQEIYDEHKSRQGGMQIVAAGQTDPWSLIVLHNVEKEAPGKAPSLSECVNRADPTQYCEGYCCLRCKILRASRNKLVEWVSKALKEKCPDGEELDESLEENLDRLVAEKVTMLHSFVHAFTSNLMETNLDKVTEARETMKRCDMYELLGHIHQRQCKTLLAKNKEVVRVLGDVIEQLKEAEKQVQKNIKDANAAGLVAPKGEETRKGLDMKKELRNNMLLQEEDLMLPITEYLSAHLEDASVWLLDQEGIHEACKNVFNLRKKGVIPAFKRAYDAFQGWLTERTGMLFRENFDVEGVLVPIFDRFVSDRVLSNDILKQQLPEVERRKLCDGARQAFRAYFDIEDERNPEKPMLTRVRNIFLKDLPAVCKNVWDDTFPQKGRGKSALDVFLDQGGPAFFQTLAQRLPALVRHILFTGGTRNKCGQVSILKEHLLGFRQPVVALVSEQTGSANEQNQNGSVLGASENGDRGNGNGGYSVPAQELARRKGSKAGEKYVFMCVCVCVCVCVRARVRVYASVCMCMYAGSAGVWYVCKFVYVCAFMVVCTGRHQGRPWRSSKASCVCGARHVHVCPCLCMCIYRKRDRARLCVRMYRETQQWG
jgi:hypothetical protein